MCVIFYTGSDIRVSYISVELRSSFKIFPEFAAVIYSICYCD